MAEVSTLARPYAKAAFSAAQTAGETAQWGELLTLLATVSEDSEGRRVLAHPTLTAQQKADWLTQLADASQFEAGVRFISVLADNDRLDLLKEINDQFDAMRRLSESSAVVHVESAMEISSEQQQALSSALARRLNKEVSLEISVNADLIGGVVIRADDLVIDGSVSGKLAKLAEQLKP